MKRVRSLSREEVCAIAARGCKVGIPGSLDPRSFVPDGLMELVSIVDAQHGKAVVTYSLGSSAVGRRVKLYIEGANDLESVGANATDNTGLIVWPASFVICEWLCSQHCALQGMRVMELGAGCGLAGIVAGKLGAQVSMTDGNDQLVEVMQRNMRINEGIESASCGVLLWGSDVPFQQRHVYDMVVGADLCYVGISRSIYDKLFESVDALLSEASHSQFVLSVAIRGRKAGCTGDSIASSRLLIEAAVEAGFVPRIIDSKQRDHSNKNIFHAALISFTRCGESESKSFGQDAARYLESLEEYFDSHCGTPGKQAHGVKPMGNALLDDSQNRTCRGEGLGSLRRCGDEVVLTIFGLLGALDLCRLGCCSRALMVFTNHDTLWRALALSSTQWTSATDCSSTWKTTLFSLCCKNNEAGSIRRRAPIQVFGLYSDILSLMWALHPLPMDEGWLQETIDRDVRWCNTKIPIIVENVVTRWLAAKQWDRAYIAKQLPTVDGARWTWQQGHATISHDASRNAHAVWSYIDIMKNDEYPAYLHCGLGRLACDINTSDILATGPRGKLSSTADTKLNGAVLKIGPRRAGVINENTVAGHCRWEAVISGAKKVVLQHSSKPCKLQKRAGVRCAVAWFSNFCSSSSARKRRRLNVELARSSFECTLRSGDLLFVPVGWRYSELLLDETVALQGYCEMQGGLNTNCQAAPGADEPKQTAISESGLAWLDSLSGSG